MASGPESRPRTQMRVGASARGGKIPGVGGSGSSTAAVDREGKNATVLARPSSSHGSTGSTSSADAEESATASSAPPSPSPSPPLERVHEQPGEGSGLGADRKGKAAVHSPASCSRGSAVSTFSTNADANEQLARALQETDFLGMPLGAADKKQMIWPQGKDESFFNQHLPGKSKLTEDISENGYDEGFFNKPKLGNKITLMEFAHKYEGNITFMQKFMVLHDSYCFVRRTDGDGSCFYRSFIFSYLEKAMAIADKDVRTNEAIRLRERIESGMQSCLLGLHRMADARFERSFSGSEFVVKLIEDGLTAGELYERELTENITSRILPLLSSLAEIELCTRESFYKWFLTDHASISELCVDEVRLDYGEASHLTIQALVNALGIATVIGCVDKSDGGVEMTLSPESGHYDILYARE